MTFHPRALIATVVFASVLWYAIEHEFGLAAAAVEAYLTFGFWAFTDRRGRLRPDSR